MFLPTKPYNEFLENYKKEPSIRIGKRVPKNAVNMAYYFNPTATDAEKVLCADAPRNTIDHRVEEVYRYLFDMPEANDNLFEKTVTWNDEEGYSGLLPRIWVKWYEKNHVTEKNMQIDKTVIVDDKGDVPTSTNYQDSDGFEGNLFLDTTDYEVKNTKTEIVNNNLYLEIKDHELCKKEVVSSQLNYYMKNPNTDSSSPWPKELIVKANGVYDSSGNKWGDNPYDGYITQDGNPLVFTNVEKDPMRWTSEGKGVPSYQEEFGYISLYAKQVSSNPFTKTVFTTDDEIQEFVTMMSTYTCDGKSSEMGKKIEQWRTDTEAGRAKYKIKIYRKDFEKKTISGDNVTEGAGDYYLAGYNIIYTHISENENGVHDWYVYANYSGILAKPYEEIKIYPVSWEAKCHYTGIIRKVWHTYDGIACYRGSIIKNDGVGNVNPELNPDILMYPDDEGFLRKFDINGNNYYKIEAEQFYITDVFKDNTACFYKYDLKYPIHDYRGPDDNGFYEGDAIKVYTSNLKNIPDNYKYQLKLEPSEYEIKQEVIDGEIQETKKVKKYNASLFTSFISKTTDTYKATYNAFVDFNTDEIINTQNGIDEDIYNKPFMINGLDFNVVPKNEATRINKIKILNPNIIEDTRRYITFEYQVTAYKKIIGGAGGEKVFTSQKRQGSILNKEYAVESEYNKFIDRSMIISPKEYENYMSPFDIIIKDQAASGQEPIITLSNSHEFIFYCKPVEETLNSDFIGAINITCNPDGSGVITAETTLDTGFYNSKTGTYTKKLIINNPYIVENGKIYAGYMVKCLDVRNISVKAPREEHLLESWYPLIQFGHYSQVMEQYGTRTKICYSMPEYDEQYWGKYGKPYVDIEKEQAEILNPHMVKVRNHPLYLRDDIQTIKVYRQKENELYDINITNVSFSEGIIITKEAISENDIILVDYTYLEEFYVYRGFNRNEFDFARIDLNPNQYHTYGDLNKEPSELAPTKNLFNKTIYFYLRPTIRLNQKIITEEKIEIDSSDNSMFNDLYLNSNVVYYSTVEKEYVDNDISISALQGFHTLSLEDKTKIWTQKEVTNIDSSISNSISTLTNIELSTMFLTDTAYKNYTHYVTLGCFKDKQEDNPNPYFYIDEQTKKVVKIENRKGLYKYDDDDTITVCLAHIQKDNETHSLILRIKLSLNEGKGIFTDDLTNIQWVNEGEQFCIEHYSSINNQVVNSIVAKDYSFFYKPNVAIGLQTDYTVNTIPDVDTINPSDYNKYFISKRYTGSSLDGWASRGDITVKIVKTSEGIQIYRTDVGKSGKDNLISSPVITINYNDLLSKTGIDWNDSGQIGYGAWSQAGTYIKDIELITENVVIETKDVVWDYDNPLVLNKETLYHTIDKYEPESELDIYIGSVYIRQNTSLQSTILIDTRTRGGGVIEEMKDSLRKELEPESDFYLDIGCYDGTPYQENAVIIVRLDNSILKEYGGRFTQTDIEEKVNKWLGLGVYPIIEYVDSYSKYDMPQYNLIVEDSYTNVINQTPELTLECISV